VRWAVILLLAGCSGLPTVPEKVMIPVAVPCIDRVPERPAFLTDAELAALDDYRLVLGLRTDQLTLRGHVAVLEAVLQACVR